MAQIFRCRNEPKVRKSHKIKSDPSEDAAFANEPIDCFGDLDSSSSKSCHLHEPHENADSPDETSVFIKNLTCDKPIAQSVEEKAHVAIFLNSAFELEDGWPCWLHMQLKEWSNTQAQQLETQSALIQKSVYESSGVEKDLSHPKAENHHDGTNQELDDETRRQADEHIVELYHRFASELNRPVEGTSPALQEASALRSETQRS
jgi:hypothetical protein